MKRWLSLAIAGWSLTPGLAPGQDTVPVQPRGSASTRLMHVKPIEVAARPQGETAKPADAAKPPIEPGSPAGLTPLEGTAECPTDCSQAPFLDTMAGIKHWCGERFELQTLRSWAGADGSLVFGDVEDPYWFRFEFLAGWFRRYDVPPMLSTSNPQTSRGILGNEGTRVLFGGVELDLQAHNGGRGAIGFWVEPQQSWGFETRYFFLADRHSGVKFRSEGDPLLAAPFFNALTDDQDALPLANLALTDPDLGPRRGFADLYANSRLQGLEINSVSNYFRGTRGRVDLIWGYRYLRLDEGINNQFVTFVPVTGQPTAGTFFFISDQFGTENSFHGLNGALRSQWWWDCWSLEVSSQLAVGATRATGQVIGQTTSVTTTNVVTPQFGGIYALPINSGTTTRLRLAAATEIEVGLGYQVYDHLRLTASYSFLLWSGVVRPGDLIDTRINPNQFPPVTSGGPLLPERRFGNSTFWMNSLSVGMEFRY